MELKSTFRGHRDTVYRVIQLTSGDLCSCSADGTIKIWDSSYDNRSPSKTWKSIMEGDAIRTLIGHSSAVSTINEKDNFLFSSSNREIIKWNLQDGRFVFTIAIAGLKYVAMLDYWIGAAVSNNIQLYDSIDGALKYSFVGHTADVHSFILGHNYLVASTSKDKTLRMWSIVQPNEPMATVVHGDSPSNLTILNKIWEGMASCVGSVIHVYDVYGSPKGILRGHSDTIYNLTELKSGLLCSSEFFSNVRMWDPSTGACIYSVNLRDSPLISNITQMHNGSIVLALSGGHLTVIDQKGKILQSFKGHQKVMTSVSPLLNGGFASAGKGRCIRIWGL